MGGGFAHGKDGICTVVLAVAEQPMDEGLRIVLFYVLPAIGARAYLDPKRSTLSPTPKPEP